MKGVRALAGKVNAISIVTGRPGVPGGVPATRASCTGVGWPACGAGAGRAAAFGDTTARAVLDNNCTCQQKTNPEQLLSQDLLQPESPGLELREFPL